MQLKPVRNLIRRLATQNNEVSKKQARTVDASVIRLARLARLAKMPFQTPAPERTAENCLRHRLPLRCCHRAARTKKTFDDSLGRQIQQSDDFAQIKIERRPRLPRNRTESFHTCVREHQHDGILPRKSRAAGQVAHGKVHGRTTIS